ncbi:hypothetical protein J0910_00360 [Nocardiopsis sp. CNT-189]|uniref:hypothetical protein n=1 Tax=Nocardiopsis oceanisediminis TaxID=2816862 RepID=UPI003B315F07
MSVAVMAHPDRREHAALLAEQVGAPIVWDRNGQVADTCLRALEAYDPAASHHVILQDDAVVCGDLLAGLARASQVAGNRPIGLYLGALRPRDRMAPLLEMALATGAPWIEFDGPRWGVACAHPVPLLPELIARYRLLPGIKQDDTRGSQAYAQMRVKTLFTVPSLVEHGDLPSLTKPDTVLPPRRAAAFIGEDASALDVDWHGPVVTKDSVKRRR